MIGVPDQTVHVDVVGHGEGKGVSLTDFNAINMVHSTRNVSSEK